MKKPVSAIGLAVAAVLWGAALVGGSQQEAPKIEPKADRYLKAMSSYYHDLPPGCQTVVIEGITYYLYDGVYYQAYLYGGQTVDMVVPT
jgi:hypothetical protein